MKRFLREVIVPASVVAIVGAVLIQVWHALN